MFHKLFLRGDDPVQPATRTEVFDDLCDRSRDPGSEDAGAVPRPALVQYPGRPVGSLRGQRAADWDQIPPRCLSRVRRVHDELHRRVPQSRCRNIRIRYLYSPTPILSTFTIALLAPASGGSRCDRVCSAVHRRTIPLELVWYQPLLSRWNDCSTFPSLLRNLIMHSSFLIRSPKYRLFPCDYEKLAQICKKEVPDRSVKKL